MKTIRNFILALACVVVFSGCRERILHDLDELEANRLLAELYKVEASPMKVQQADGKWSISVAAEDTQRAMQHLYESRLLRETRPPLPQAQSMIPSREEQRFQFERALSREIEYTLTNVEGVLQARVHLNLPARDPFLGQSLSGEEKGSASVLIVATSSFDMPGPEITKLVAGASGIASQAVAVMISRSDERPASPRSEAEVKTAQKAAPFLVPVSALVQAVIVLTLIGGLAGYRKLMRKRVGRRVSRIAQVLQRGAKDAAAQAV